jgi:hypothetical protein
MFKEHPFQAVEVFLADHGIRFGGDSALPFRRNGTFNLSLSRGCRRKMVLLAVRFKIDGTDPNRIS